MQFKETNLFKKDSDRKKFIWDIVTPNSEININANGYDNRFFVRETAIKFHINHYEEAFPAHFYYEKSEVVYIDIVFSFSKMYS